MNRIIIFVAYGLCTFMTNDDLIIGERIAARNGSYGPGLGYIARKNIY